MEKVSYLELLSSCIDVAQAASKIINAVFDEGKNKVAIDKKTSNLWEDCQTVADVRSQNLIIGSLRKAFPSLLIIGEEDDASCQKIIDEHDDIFTTDKTKCDHLASIVPDKLSQLDVADLIVWVDPLDGTKEYTLGFIDNVTTLVGISYKGHALAGVVYVPFSGQLFYGGIGVGCHGDVPMVPAVGSQFSIMSAHPVWKEYADDTKTDTKPTAGELVDCKSVPVDTVVTSRSHMTPSLQHLLDSLNIHNVMRMGGAGNKGIKLLVGLANAYVFPQPGTKRWDICAMEALITAHGGVLTDAYGHTYTYEYCSEAGNRTSKDYNNSNGVVASIHVNHSRFLLHKDTQVSKI